MEAQRNDETDKLDNLQKSKEDLKTAVDNITMQIEELQNIGFESSNKIEKINLNIGISKEKIVNNNANIKRLDEEKQEVEKRIKELEEEKSGKKENPIDEWVVATGKHQGIIPGAEWVNCQKILEEISRKASPRKATGNKFLLSGMLKCAKCGSSMCSWSRTSRGIYYRSYRCELKNRAATRCDSKMVNADDLESFVIELCKNINLEEIINIKKTKNNNSTLKRELTSLNKTLVENDKLLQGLVKKLALIDDIDILTIIQAEIKKIKS